jgi:hypothetical protein
MKCLYLFALAAPAISGLRHALYDAEVQAMTTAGRFFPNPVACSNACAICSTLKSDLSRLTI